MLSKWTIIRNADDLVAFKASTAKPLDLTADEAQHLIWYSEPEEWPFPCLARTEIVPGGIAFKVLAKQDAFDLMLSEDYLELIGDMPLHLPPLSFTPTFHHIMTVVDTHALEPKGLTD